MSLRKLCRLMTILPKQSRHNSTKSKGSNEVSLLGVPFSGGQPKDGVEHGPKVLREAGLVERIEKLGRKVHDLGDLEIEPFEAEVVEYDGAKLLNPYECGSVSKMVAEKVKEGALADRICVTIGGDHSIAAGSVYGHTQARGSVSVLWIDAHADINSYKTSPSGNMHGMPVSFLLSGMGDFSGVPGHGWIKPCLNQFNIAYIGLRDIDPGEYKILYDMGIMTFSMYDIDRYGISTVTERAIEAINPRLDRPMHLSYDIDSLDPLYSPSTGTAVYGGLTLREGLFIGEHISKLGLLGALDIVEVNPRIGQSAKDANLTTETAMRIIEGCLGKHRSGYTSDRTFAYKYHHFDD